ncbi:Uncharacterised protein [Staphylococcus gallinarum]|uniref:Uncharacterized protein n=1 Tax=Staphylococcus gallinarum TaxID=1293 RepID=A0A380FCU5_STAGA|nr:Uncharacterised protein [Staphylococcus gallinarum]
MEKEKVIQLIEQELVQADEASSKVEFEKTYLCNTYIDRTCNK